MAGWVPAMLEKSLCNRLLDGLDVCGQAALVASRGVLVQDTLLDRLIERGNGLAKLLFGSYLVACCHDLAHLSQRAAHAGTVVAIHFGLLQGLPDALQRRYMVRHLYVSPCPMECCSVGAEALSYESPPF
jgi:hypothetical protein